MHAAACHHRLYRFQHGLETPIKLILTSTSGRVISVLRLLRRSCISMNRKDHLVVIPYKLISGYEEAELCQGDYTTRCQDLGIIVIAKLELKCVLAVKIAYKYFV